MKLLVKRILPVVITLALVMSVLTISVAAAGSSVAFSKSQLKVGEALTVTARFSTSSSDPMYGLEGYITYNPAIVEFVSGDNCNLLTAGKVKIVMQSAGKTNLEQSISFKALAVGNSAIALENLIYVNSEDLEKSLSGSSATVTVVDTSAQASGNANLKALSVSSGTLTPKFNPDVTEYSLTIPNDVTELWVSTTKADIKATTNVEGSRNMKVGLNKRVVVVTAENGTVKKYTINITRLAADGQTPEVEPTPEDEGLNNLSEVIVGDQKMYVVEDFTGAELPQGFSVIEYAFDGKTIPALSDEAYVLLMLRLPDNSASGLYIYSKNGEFTPLITITVGAQNYYVLPADEAPLGFTAANDVTVNEVAVPAYRSDKVGYEDFALIYAKGPSGKNSFYVYDTVEQTIQRASGIVIEKKVEQPANTEQQNIDILTNFVELNTNGKIVVITILAIIVLLITAVVVLIVKIATAGRKDEEEYDEEDDDQALNDNSDIVDFEFISVSNDTKAEPATQEETEEAAEEAEEDTEENEE
ncbi:MAG: cadherin-like beta sandwich domain-containing protein [Clostridia bacterium]|nr:cadherin-like beta sandwich domain-containing protein [Clostridia bacterium]